MTRRVVITGVGAVTPLGNSARATWEAALRGVCGVGPITRFDDTDFKVHVAAELKDFDPLDFMERALLRKTDVFSQVALAAAADAFEDAGKVDVASERFGVYIGSGVGGMATLVENVKLLADRGPSRVSPHFIPNMIVNMAAAHVAMRYGLHGPCLATVTACATSTDAIGEAYLAIATGRADAMIAGGTEAALIPETFAGFAACQALTQATDPAAASLPFDARRAGFVLGEGAGLVILEERSHALARGARIYAEVAGYGNTNDAFHLTAPDPAGVTAARAVTTALEEAELTGEARLYINAHGTGTKLNDATETTVYKKAFGEELAHKLVISSTKSMMGHTLGAAGGIEAIMAAKALATGEIPPTIGLAQADPDCDLDYTPGTARKAELVGALSTNFGFGGHNAVLALRKAD